MFKYKKVRNFLFKRNLDLFKKEYNWDYKFLKSPHKKIKTVFNLEIAAVLIYFLSKTNIKANHVILFGVIWVYLGSVLIFFDYLPFTYIALLIFFTKLIPDYMDGTLAHLKNEQSKEGFELDLWAGEVNKLGVITGVIIYIYNQTFLEIYLYLLLAILLTNFIDPRKHLSRTKFGISNYKKNVRTHVQKIKKESGVIFNFLKFLNFDGRSNYSDFLILLIIIDLQFNYNEILFFVPWLWISLSILSFLRANYIIFFKK